MDFMGPALHSGHGFSSGAFTRDSPFGLNGKRFRSLGRRLNVNHLKTKCLVKLERINFELSKKTCKSVGHLAAVTVGLWKPKPSGANNGCECVCRRELCRPSGSFFWKVIDPVADATDRDCASPPGLEVNELKCV